MTISLILADIRCCWSNCMTRYKREFDSDLTLVEFFQQTTVASQAERVSSSVVLRACTSTGPKPRARKTAAMSKHMPPHAVAIIGMAGRFPGARNLDEFWHNISNGVEILDTLTDAELDAAGFPVTCDQIRISCPNIQRSRTQIFSMPVSSECRRARLKLLIPNNAFFWNARGRLSRTPDIPPGGAEQSVGVYAGASMNTLF